MKPPRLARALLRSLPADVRRAAIADLDEEFTRHILASRGVRRARLWYWRQTIGSLMPAVRLRVRAAGRGAADSPARANRLAPYVAECARDVRFSLRRLRRDPGFAAAVAATLAIGIGATIAIFALTHAVLLSGAPYPDADRLVTISEIDTRRETSSGNVSYPDWLDYRSQNTTFESIGGFSGGSRTVVDGSGVADRVQMAEVTGGFFRMLGVLPAAGRDFTDADTAPGAPPVVILTDGAWRRRFGADPSIVGRTIQINAQPVTVVGILPPPFEFRLRAGAEIWLPMQPTAAQRERRYTHWFDLVGRLAPDADIAAARADLGLIASRFAIADPRYHPAARVNVVTLHERVSGPVRGVLLVLQAAAGFLLLVACANIAGLLIARGLARAHEQRLRAAIGASRARLIRQSMVESFVLAAPGVLGGLILGVVGVRAFVASLPRGYRAALPSPDAIGLGPEIVLAAAGLGLLSALVFGVVPTRQASRQSGDAHLRARGGAGRRDLRLQSVFVATQLALSLVLVTGATLLGRSVFQLLQVSPGFDPRHVLTMQVNGTEPAYSGADETRAMHDRLLEGIAALPGVEGAATISQLPLAGRGNSGMFVVQSAPARPEVSTLIRTVSRGYFDVMGVPLVAGRPLSPADVAGAPPVVLVNQTLARTILGGRAVGERIAFPFFPGRPWWEIVGVVGDEQFVSLDREMSPVVYFPFEQSVSNAFAVVVRTSVPPESLTTHVRQVAARQDPLLPVYQIETMEQTLGRSDAVSQRRSTLALLAVFAFAAASLAAVGLYGLMAHSVAQRTRELGIRIALGADRRRVLGAVIGRGARLTAVGIGVGMLLSVVASRSLGSLLFRIASIDPITLVAAIFFLSAVAALACVVPALRAARIDPVIALRGDIE